MPIPLQTKLLSLISIYPHFYYMKMRLALCKTRSLSFPTQTRKCTAHSNIEPQTKQLKLGKRWREFHGSNNWEGLLDPLDNKLRYEILRYGKFVEATYTSFEFDPSSPHYGHCIYPKYSLLHRSGFPKTGYRLTKNLHATSGIDLPSWIDKFSTWISKRSSWIGYIAVCQDEEEIARLGRRDIVIAYRGTTTCLEWVENLRSTLTQLSNNKSDISRSYLQGPMVETGFLSLYTSFVDNCRSLQEEVREEISKILQSYGDDSLSITITGHSLGAALATLTAYDLKKTFSQSPSIAVISFGGPRVGNQKFRCEVQKYGIKILRIVNSADIVTKVPGFVINNDDDVASDVDNIRVASPRVLSRWLKKLVVQKTKWNYVDVGHELRLCSNDSPIINGRHNNVATCHDLNTYLHLINGFQTSACPFRR